MNPKDTILKIVHPTPQGTQLLNAPNFQKKGIEMNTTVFFLLILLYHILITFQGVDLLDEGFHVSFYQQIFNDPQSVQYSFFYWFSGLVGGAILESFPTLGLWGIRLAGAIVSTLTILIAYNLLKDYISTKRLKISLFILALFINSEPKDLHYNNLSAFFFFLAVYFLFKGLTKKNQLLIFVSGAILSLNIFTRFPNLVGLGMGLVIFYHAYLFPEARKTQWKSFLFYALGAISMLAVVLLIMQQMGHLEYYINSIKYLFSMSTNSSKKDGLGGSYGLVKMIYSPLKQYSISVGSVILIIAFLFFSSYLFTIRNSLNKISRTIVDILPIGLVLFILGLIVTDKIKLLMLIYFFSGVCLFFAIFVFFFSRKKEVQLLSLIGTFIIIVHPFGSAPGIVSVVIYSMWLSFPIAVDYLYSLRSVEADFRIQTSGSLSYPQISIPESRIHRMITGIVFIIVFLCMYHIFFYPYFYDYHKRIEMTHKIENKNMRFIYTSKARAEKINELLAASAPYVKPNDYVLAYDAIPMYHFMTETKPYLNNPSPMFYSTELFSTEMEKATANKALPVIIKQNINTIHEGSRWPEEIVIDNYFNDERSLGRNTYFNEFLTRHHYKEIWTNEIFSIYLPPGKTGK